MKAIVYIDGFNLYHRALKRTRLKWLNLQALCEKLLPDLEVHLIRYFTAEIIPQLADPNQLERQKKYLRALGTLDKVEIHLGKFIKQQAKRLLVGNEKQRALVWEPREKKSDVNLAANLVHDAHLGAFDIAAIITNDSDFTTAIRIVAEDLQKDVLIICPRKPVSVDLRRVATEIKVIYRKLLRKCQFPTTMEDSEGVFHRPPSW